MSDTMPNLTISGLQGFLDELWDEQDSMAQTINIHHPDFIGSDEQECYRNHELAKMKIEKIKGILANFSQTQRMIDQLTK